MWVELEMAVLVSCVVTLMYHAPFRSGCSLQPIRRNSIKVVAHTFGSTFMAKAGKEAEAGS